MREHNERDMYPRTIPWDIAEKAYLDYQKRFGKDYQSLVNIARRGGFSVGEMDLFYPEWVNEI